MYSMLPMDNNKKQLDLLVSLTRITFLNLAEKIILLKNIDSANDLALLSIEEIKQIVNRNIKVSSWDGKKNLLAAQKEICILAAKGIKSVLYSDSEYPALLRETTNAPFMLFYLGDISVLSGKTVSVVGTRKITPDAKKATFEFAYEACKDGCSVVSGLANGVDGFAHSGAVDAYYDANQNSVVGKTVAVLPVGCDTVTPYSHKRLAEKILQTGGCLISEYVPGVSAEPWRFVQRNRIIAGLSPATVVIQAPCGSGSLITAEYAMEYNRDVMFHSVAFSDNANIVAKTVKSELDSRFAKGTISKHKLENSPEKFVESGAPVINSYSDYCKCFSEPPGKRCCNIKDDGQLELPNLK